jgi:hypothetical protein
MTLAEMRAAFYGHEGAMLVGLQCSDRTVNVFRERMEAYYRRLEELPSANWALWIDANAFSTDRRATLTAPTSPHARWPQASQSSRRMWRNVPERDPRDHYRFISGDLGPYANKPTWLEGHEECMERNREAIQRRLDAAK